MAEIDKILAEIAERIRELEQERDFYKHAYYELVDKMLESMTKRDGEEKA